MKHEVGVIYSSIPVIAGLVPLLSGLDLTWVKKNNRHNLLW